VQFLALFPPGLAGVALHHGVGQRVHSRTHE
jgi:hypothetical protein